MEGGNGLTGEGMAGKFPRSKLLQDDANLGRGYCGCANVAETGVLFV